MANELIKPEIAEEDPNSYELIRVWAAKGEQHVSMNWNVWEDEPGTWGMVLAHLAGILRMLLKRKRIWIAQRRYAPSVLRSTRKSILQLKCLQVKSEIGV